MVVGNDDTTPVVLVVHLDQKLVGLRAADLVHAVGVLHHCEGVDDLDAALAIKVDSGVVVGEEDAVPAELVLDEVDALGFAEVLGGWVAGPARIFWM